MIARNCSFVEYDFYRFWHFGLARSVFLRHSRILWPYCAFMKRNRDDPIDVLAAAEIASETRENLNQYIIYIHIESRV